MIRKFLLADDDQDDTDFFREALKGINSSIEFNYAQNGKELIAKLNTGNIDPQIIFLDINMPEMNGWECLEKLKKESDYKDVPVIMYSTSSLKIYGRKAIKSGALCFYEKPPNFLKLKEFLVTISASSETDLKNTLKAIQDSKVHRVYTE
jgi:CheY-like chemotaxis protein